MRFFSTKNISGKIKNGFSTLALGLLMIGSAQAEVLDFHANGNGCNADLAWTSNGVSGITSYDVQKSSDGVTYTTINTIRRSQTNTYEYSVRQPEQRAIYRIVENNRNTFSIASTATAVKTNCSTGIIIDTPAIGFYPNPMLASIGGDLHITLENEGAKMLNIQITDVTGRIIVSQNSKLHRGLNQIDMNVGELATGSYLIVTSADGATPKAARFIVQK